MEGKVVLGRIVVVTVEREFTEEVQPDKDRVLVGSTVGAGWVTLQYSIFLLFWSVISM